jgi:putative redox protein
MRSEKVSFQNSEGLELAGNLHLAPGYQHGPTAIFAHCFTCGKDLKAARNLAIALNQRGINVLRFDFSGLGQSEGDFADTNFSSNLEDLFAAAEFLRQRNCAPEILIGHSLGGAAVLMAADRLPEVKAVATIGAPAEAHHVKHLFEEQLETIKGEGSAKVNIGGRPFTLKRDFIKDLNHHEVGERISKWRNRALLVLHSPQDQIVGIQNAKEIYEAGHHPKSFVSLDGADHLLSKESDSRYVGELVAAWAERYLESGKDSVPRLKSDSLVLAQTDDEAFLTRIKAGEFFLVADEPESVGGQNRGPSPYELLGASLAACTSMTLRMYADRKEWPLQTVKVHVDYEADYVSDMQNCENEKRRLGRFIRKIEILGDLDEKQEKRLMQIADKCPVHRTLSEGVEIHTKKTSGS